MAYPMKEPIGGLGENRIFSIITVENMIGLAGGAGAMYGVCMVIGIRDPGFGAGFWIQLLLMGFGAFLGTILTIRWGGLSLFDRGRLALLYRTRSLSGQHRVQPPAAQMPWGSADLDMSLELADDEEPEAIPGMSLSASHLQVDA